MSKKEKNILLSVLLIGIISMTVAFATLSTRLNIGGTAEVKAQNWKIVIDDWQRVSNYPSLVDGQRNTVEEVTTANIANDTASITGVRIKFKQPGDTIKYTFNIENKGTIDAQLESWSLDSNISCISNNESIECPITREIKCNGVDPVVGSTLAAGESISCTYVISYPEVNGSNGYEISTVDISGLGADWNYVQKASVPVTISFNTYGGSTINDVHTAAENEIDLPEISKEGYTLSGWTDVENGVEAKYTGSTYTANTNVTLYPVFIKIKYNLTYDLDNGEANNPDGYYIDSETLTLNNPTKAGYTFTGWSGTDLTGNANTEVTIPSGSTGDRSYEAHYNTVGYTITYNLNGGTNNSNNPSSYTVETNDITLANPSKANYKFTGWTGEGINEPTKNIKIEKGSTGNKEYTANYTPTSYTLSYTLNGGSVTNPESYTVESNDITLNNPTKEGYTFTGWSGTDLTGNANTSVTIPSGSTGNRSYEAHYNTVGYTITYNLNGGTNNSNNPNSYTIETNDITLANPSKSGYTFTGWTGEGITTPTKNIKIEKGSTGNKTYIANYSVNIYIVTYNLNGGSANNPGTYTVEDEITLNNPTKEGYTFTGWSGTDLTGSANTEVTIEKGSTEGRGYEAHYTPTNYTITYNLDNGTNNSNNPSTYTIESDDITLGNPSKTGYTFTGWTGEGITTPTKNIKIDSGSIGNKTYNANYTPISYTISYTLNGGSVTNPESYTVESNAITLNNPTKAGYTFTGWSGTGLTGNNNTTVTIPSGSTGNRSYEAHFSANTYEITFNANGGSGGQSSAVTATYDSNMPSISTTAPTRTGYTFGGWYDTSASTGGNEYYTAAGASARKWNKIEDTELYARWSANALKFDDKEVSKVYNEDAQTFNVTSASNGTGTYTYSKVSGESDITVSSTGVVTIPEKKTVNTTGYTIVIRATDSNSAATKTATYTIKITKAEITPTVTMSDYTYKGTVSTPGITGNSGNGGVTYYYNTTDSNENGTEWKNISNTTLNAGTYYIYAVVNATTNYKGKTTGTTSFKVNQASVGTPTGIGVNTNGIVTWTGSTNATGYQISIDGTNYTNASSGVNYLSTITGTKGKRTVYVRAINSDSTNYKTPSSAGSKEVMVYSLGLTAGTGINSTTGAGNYINGKEVSIDAEVKNGYKWKTWTKNSGTAPASLETKSTTVTIGADTTLTASATVNTYTISYTLNGGSVTNPESYTVESNAITLNNPTKEGYTFTGWSGTDLTGNNNTTVTIASGSIGNRSYEAHFSKTITLTQKHGTSTTTQSYTLIDKETEHEFTLENTKDSFGDWEFIGWLNNGTPKVQDYSPTGKITISDDKTVYASYRLKLTATFIDYTGTEKQTRKVEGYAYGNNNCGGVGNQYPTLKSSSQSTYTGWTTNGWSTSTESNASSTLASNTDFSIQSNTTYYGLYKQNVVLSYNANGGSTTPSSETKVRTTNSYAISTYSNPTFTLAAGISRNGYTFSKWTVGSPISADKDAKSTITPTSGTAITATAKWSAVNYTISYDGNTGTLASNPSTYNIETSTFTLNNPTKTVTVVGNANNSGATIGSNTSAAQTFYGWSGTGLTGTNNKAVSITKGSTGNRSYTANYQSVAVTLPKATKTGYTCYWYDSNNVIMGESEQSWMPSATSETTVNAYASCEANTYTVSFNANNGSGGQSSSVNATYGSNMPSISTTAPTRTGYTFGGWYDTSSSTGGTQYYTASGASARTWNKTSNTTLYARWTPITYTISYSLDSGTAGNKAPTSGTYASTVEISNPTKDGYTFLGWTATNLNTSTAKYGSTSSPSTTWNGTTKVTDTYFKNLRSTTGTVTLTANWKANINYICKRASTLHTPTCTQSGTGGCAASGDVGNGNTITYGSIGTGSTLTAGEALDCKVSTTGGYTERFYYITDLESNSNYAVLLYSQDTSSGNVAYDSSNKNWHGPQTAVSSLPTTNTWDNISLSSTSRQLYATSDLSTYGTSTTGGNLGTFDYSGYAGRLLTVKELKAACPNASITSGSLSNCSYLMENTKYDNSSNVNYGYWLETPRASNSRSVWSVLGDRRYLDSSSASTSGRYGARPAIEVLKSKIQLD